MRDSKDTQRRAAWALGVLGTLVFAVIGGFSFRRHLHVDELENLYSIQLCGAYSRPDYMLPVDLYEVVLAPLTRRLTSSLTIFVTIRWLFLAGLVGLCAAVAQVQRALPSPLGKVAIFFCALLFGPLYRHGFEVRHDIFVGLALAVLYWICEKARTRRLTLVDTSMSGAIVALAQANSFKAFVVCAPALGLCAILSARGHPRSMRTFLVTLSRFVPGFLAGALLAALIFTSSGALGPYLSHFRKYVEFSLRSPYRLSPLPLVAFVAANSPVHTLLVMLGVFAVATRIKARRALDEALVPACFFLISLFAAWLNPTLFPYNLTWIAPSVLWMCALGLSEAQRLLRPSSAWLRTSTNTTALLLGLVFLVRTQQGAYFRKTWDEQLRVVTAVEALTSVDEPVVNLTGLVISRPPPSRDWLVHSLLMVDYHAGRRESVAHVIGRTWPSVIVGGHYRWGFVDESDRRIVTQNYVPISRELWVLGSVVRPDSSRISLHRKGRYLVSAAQTEGPLGTIDTRSVSAGEVLDLASGSHSVALQNSSWQLAWLGPARTLPVASISSPLFESADLPGH